MLLVLWRQLVKKLFQPHNYTTRWQPGFAAGFFLSRRGEPFSLVPNRLDGDENAAQEFDRFDVTSLDRLGMTLREAREIWRRRQADLVSVDVQGWKAEVLQEDLDRLDGASLEQPVIRLLPYFDTYLLGHRERDHLASAQHRSFIYRPQGWISPVLLVDGRAAGTWEQIRQGGRLLVQVKKLGPLSRQVRAGIRAEARELGRFLEEPQVKVEVV